MDWKQIETKWGAMARRCRADVRCAEVEESVAVSRRVSKAEVAESVGVKQVTADRIEAPQNRDPVSSH